VKNNNKKPQLENIDQNQKHSLYITKQLNSMNLIHFIALKTYLKSKSQSLIAFFFFFCHSIKNK